MLVTCGVNDEEGILPSAKDDDVRGMENAETPGFSGRGRGGGGKCRVEEGGRRRKRREGIGVGLIVSDRG